MKKKMKSLLVSVLAGMLVIGTAIPSFAGEWKKDSELWWYQNDDGSYTTNNWQEINGQWYYFDGNGYMVANQWIDGMYYVGSDGAMLANTITPDRYRVGNDGAWIWNDVMKDVYCTSIWAMKPSNIVDNGSYYTVTGNMYDEKAHMEFCNIVGSDGYFEEMYPETYAAMDHGLRKENVTIYVPKNTETLFYDVFRDSYEIPSFFTRSYASLEELIGVTGYKYMFGVKLQGDVAITVYDTIRNYVS